jgi:DNA polymerase-1
MFVARPGYKLVVADYSQMELRMLAHYSQDPLLLQAFEQDLDLHVITGARQGGMSYDELKALVDADDPEGKKLRSIGKTSNFALTYGMAAKKYQLRLAVDNGLWVPLDTAAQWIEDYNATWQGATDWKARATKYAHYLGHITTIAGRKRRLPDLYSADRYEVLRAERQAINAIIQGSCADVISYVIPFIQAALRPMGGTVLLQVHDEIVCEVPEEMAPVAARAMGVLMADLANERFKLRCPMMADAHIGDNWGDAKG